MMIRAANILKARTLAVAASASVAVAVAVPSGPADAQTPGTQPPVSGQQTPMGGNTSTGGSATGIVKVEQRPRLQEFALKHRESELKQQQLDVRVGTVLPANATLIDIPPEFGLDRYKLARVNEVTVLVDPATRRVEEVIR